MADTRTDKQLGWEQGYIDNVEYLAQVQAERDKAYADYTSSLAAPVSSNTGVDSSAFGYTGGGGDSVETYKNTDIRGVTTLTVDEINAHFAKKCKSTSLFIGRGQDFIDAQNESGLNAEYLISHSAEETGWGTSNILRTKFNFFGIGAFDSSPYQSAYNYDGFKAGLVAGAKWIFENYANKGQSTLYTMRWNNNVHQYATNPDWDTNIATIWSNLPHAATAAPANSGTGSLSGVEIGKVVNGKIILPTQKRKDNQNALYPIVSKLGVSSFVSLDSARFSFPNGQESNLFLPHFADQLALLHRALADALGIDKVVITSGYRREIISVEKQHSNMTVSPHMCAVSVDISANLDNRLTIADTAWGLGFRGIGVGKRHVHVDGLAEGHWAETYDGESKIYYGPGEFR